LRVAPYASALLASANTGITCDARACLPSLAPSGSSGGWVASFGFRLRLRQEHRDPLHAGLERRAEPAPNTLSVPRHFGAGKSNPLREPGAPSHGFEAPMPQQHGSFDP